MSVQEQSSFANAAALPESTGGMIATLRQTLPTIVVMVVLAVIGVWGHSTEWEFTRHRASDQPSPNRDSDPQLLPPQTSFGWCTAHGVSECPFEHAEIAQVEKRTTISASDLERAERALRLRPRPENDRNSQRTLRRIQFASAASAEKYGIDIAPAWEQTIIESVVASGEIGYDETRVTRLSARAAGSIWRVFKTTGDPVRRGDVLALVDAPDAGKAKGEFLQALVQFRVKAKAVADMKSIADQDPARFREAEAAARDAEVRLLSVEQVLNNFGLTVRAQTYQPLGPELAAKSIRFAGIPDAALAGLEPGTASTSLIPIVAPQDGIILTRTVVVGDVVDPAKVLFVVGEPRVLWLTLHVGPADAKLLAEGQPVWFRPDGSTDEFEAKLTWISAEADEKTRTVKARAEVANDQGLIRANTFGVGRIVLREETNAITVPNEAVQWDGHSFVIFVRDRDYLKPDAAKTFHARMVRIGAKDGANTEIIAGVLPGEIVATKGSALLLREMQKNIPPAPSRNAP